MFSWLNVLTHPATAALLPSAAAGGGPRAWSAPLTLLAPQDAHGLALAAMGPADQSAWLLRHLVAGPLPSQGVAETLDGSLLHIDAAGLRDASGSAVELGPETRQGGLRLRRIDRPLRPASASLIDTMAGAPDLARFAQALDDAGLAVVLGCAGPFTVLAPAHGDFKRLDAERLRLHIVPGRWPRHRLQGAAPRTWAGTPLRLTAPLLPGSDHPCRNGLLHRIAQPLRP
jgi:hypothetical protein